MRLIDADELLYDLCTSSYPQDVDIGKAYYIFKKELKNAPTVDAIPIEHGHWENTPIPIWLRNNTTRTYYFKCNKCSSTSWNRDNYCSHCGALMDEVME